MKKSDRQIVFNKYGGKCAYCGCELQKGWHVDHIEPVLRDKRYDKDKRMFVPNGFEKPENDCMENYNPSCASCNMMKSSSDMETFRHTIQNFVNSLNAYSTQYKFAKKYGLVKETEIKVKFYYETIINQ